MWFDLKIGRVLRSASVLLLACVLTVSVLLVGTRSKRAVNEPDDVLGDSTLSVMGADSSKTIDRFHIRGGRSLELQYDVDGVTVSDTLGSSGPTEPLNLSGTEIENISIVKGAWSPEYSQESGVRVISQAEIDSMNAIFAKRWTEGAVTYPYGGIPDTSVSFGPRYHPLQFPTRTRFVESFPEEVDMRCARFDSVVQFIEISFEDDVNLSGASFWTQAGFSSQFKGEADFTNVLGFCSMNFSGSTFHENVTFKDGAFTKTLRFENVVGLKDVSFEGAEFVAGGRFRESRFHGELRFERAQIARPIEFRTCDFHGYVNFVQSMIGGDIVFISSTFDGPIDFMYSVSMDTATGNVLYYGVSDTSRVRFDYCSIRGDVYLGGTPSSQFPLIGASPSFDFRTCTFDIPASGSSAEIQPAIYLYGPVKVYLQLEDIKYLYFAPTLSFFQKRNILAFLKANAYAGDQFASERFELDYRFALSTAYQRPSYNSEDLRPWFGRRLQEVYAYTMGLGYRPQRLIPYALGVMMLFAVLFFVFHRHLVYEFIRKCERPAESTGGAAWWPLLVLCCVYFSVWNFLSIRLDRRILVADSWRPKKLAVIEYAIGLLFYAYVIIGSKAGAIGQALLRLFER